jgi:plastocyanin domain-containing protein
MTIGEWLVVLSGLAAIVLVNWWFLFAERQTLVVAPGAADVEDVTILVRGGYQPSRIRVRAGRPVRLIFDRQESASCSDEVVFPAFGIRRFLPPFEKTAIEILPEQRGTYDFTCGMSMLHGTLEAE